MSNPRLAKPTDLEAVLALAARKTYAAWPSQGEGRKEKALDSLRSLPESEYDLFVTGADVSGFLVLRKRFTRGLTGDCDSVIHDYFAPGESEILFEHAAEAARSYGSKFITIEISPGELNVQAMGYELESHKISVATADCPPPEGSPYSVRPAQAGDDFVIAVLNSTMLPHTLCAGRDYDISELTFRAMDGIFQQVNRQDSQSAALVLLKGEETVGHLLLELTDRTGYIYDLAVAQEHWGGKAVLHIMRAGPPAALASNLPVLVGDVSAANLRALKIAQRYLGFAVECQRYRRKL